MTRKNIIQFIFELTKKDLSFDEYSQKIIEVVSKFDLNQVKEGLLECGVIPESFNHDSTEEKLYSKYTDILLAKALEYLGIKSSVVKQRADSADVEGITSEYSIVADAKAFRLSRTAKNQKDFKVEALSKWKKDKDFSCLVCPLYQYPKNSSQIYRQAIDKSATLLSYVHLVFMLSQKNAAKYSYKSLWLISKKLKGAKDAISYWKAIDKEIAGIFGKKVSEVEESKNIEIRSMKRVAKEEMGYLENKIKSIKTLTHREAILRLIKSEKLDSKITQIKKISGLE